MFKKLLLFIFVIFVFIAGWFSGGLLSKSESVPITNFTYDRPMDKYSFDNLSKTVFQIGNLKIKDKLKETDEFTSYLFVYEFNPNLDGKTFKKTTGQINIPKLGSSFPIIVMFRGYIDKETYKTGNGTRNASEFFAKKGFITIAPDFLGYGGSDSESDNIFETRFQTYVTATSLLKYLENRHEITTGAWKLEIGNIFLWGHSNGGQIALSVLEITKANYPTTLWAPVSKPFPYSVLYYTDESADGGKLIRRELSYFEETYDVENYSLTNYLDQISAPIQIQQGTIDEAVPKSWSDTLVNLLKQRGKDVKYFTYPETDHNMRPNWNRVIERDLEFFNNFLK